MKLSSEDCERIALFAKTFSNPIRVKLMCALYERPFNVTDLCRLISAKESNISQQLRYLWNQGYLEKERKGREIIYSIKGKMVFKVLIKLRDLTKK